MTKQDDRPDPDALLKQAVQEGRGRLKVFLGAAPGVGKTYEMLGEGAARAQAGVDVVIGVVETHGRVETEARIAGLEIVSRREVDHQGRSLDEMDIDAILARRPQLVLVDELAHANAPGSRHPKRYQDVEELLAAGIDVYSTVNIQHIESLNDVVASFTKVRVRETVPDHILDAAELEVIDLPPDELITRLKEGKVYLPAEAKRALDHFFSKSNLSALRELALRRAAQAVDTQMLDYLKRHALAGNWAGSERIVVAISELPGSDGLVRAAKRMADALHAPWTAVHVETARSRNLDDDDRERLAAAVNLASRLGGVVTQIPAASVVDGLKRFAVEARATQLIVGKSVRSRWFELRHGSVVDRLVRDTSAIAIHVLPTTSEGGGGRKRIVRIDPWPRQADYLWSALMVAAVTAIGLALDRFLDGNNVALLYLLPVMVSASRFGLRPGIFAGILSSLAFNFFFLAPTGTLTISDPQNVVTVVVMLGVALAVSQLTARVRTQADLASRSAHTNATIADFLGQLTKAANSQELAQTICAEIARLFEVRTALLRTGFDGPQLIAASPPEDRLETIELAAASWALERGVSAGRGTDTLTASDWIFYPLSTGSKTLAVVGLARSDGRDLRISDRLPLLMTLLNQAAVAVERTQLAEAIHELAPTRHLSPDRLAQMPSA